MKEFNEKITVSALSVREILAQSNQERPNITGGCILLTNASLVVAMVLMAIKISVKKTSDPMAKRFLKRQGIKIQSTQTQLSFAATNDLQVFDEYRAALNSKSKHRAIKVNTTLRKATDSLLGAAKVLQLTLSLIHDCKAYADATVSSDLNAGCLVLEAINNGVMILADSNIAQLKHEDGLP